MAAATVMERHSAVLGPLKVEFLLIDSPDSGDTVQSLMSRPIYAFATSANFTGQIINPAAEVNEATKTITIGTNDGNANIALIVVGF